VQWFIENFPTAAPSKKLTGVNSGVNKSRIVQKRVGLTHPILGVLASHQFLGGNDALFVDGGQLGGR
jgi:hypothetical protein